MVFRGKRTPRQAGQQAGRYQRTKFESARTAGRRPTEIHDRVHDDKASGSCLPALSAGFLRLKMLLTTTKKTGTKYTASTVAAIIPPITPVPTAWLLPALAPLASASGKTPRVKASEVMMIGRKRRRAASMAAATKLMPPFR